MYAKCGCLEDAIKVFVMMPQHSSASWNVLLAGLVKQGLARMASDLFRQMLMSQSHISSDIATIITMIQACVVMMDLEHGRLLHSYVLLCGIDSSVFLNNTLVDMYSKCGSLNDACEVFETMPRKDTASWNAMISGCVGLSELCVLFFNKMLDNIMPDDTSFVSIVTACASLGSIDQGTIIHLMITKTGADRTIDMANAIIDMYGKCGDIESAYRVFSATDKQDMISWNAMAAGLSQSGLGMQTLELLLDMEESGVRMNHITILALLCACSRAGLVEYGCLLSIFLMQEGEDIDVMPVQEHAAGLIDLLGRTGLVAEAFGIIHRCPFQPSPAAWRALLSASRMHNDLGRTQQATEYLLDLDPQSDAAYLMLNQAYAADASSYGVE